MSKHTSAPWTIKEDPGHKFANGETDYGGFRIDANDVEQLAYVWRANVRFGSTEPFGAAEAEANARLIAAAPDILEAAYVSLAELEAVEKEIGIPSRGAPLLRAAIAKAEGQS
jgi:hypothetical protein